MSRNKHHWLICSVTEDQADDISCVLELTEIIKRHTRTTTKLATCSFHPEPNEVHGNYLLVIFFHAPTHPSIQTPAKPVCHQMRQYRGILLFDSIVVLSISGTQDMLNKCFFCHLVFMASMTQKAYSSNKFCFSAFCRPGSILIAII